MGMVRVASGLLESITKVFICIGYPLRRSRYRFGKNGKTGAKKQYEFRTLSARDRQGIDNVYNDQITAINGKYERKKSPNLQ